MRGNPIDAVADAGGAFQVHLFRALGNFASPGKIEGTDLFLRPSAEDEQRIGLVISDDEMIVIKRDGRGRIAQTLMVELCRLGRRAA